MTGEIVPFGKYKGQPVQALAADEDYCEWLTAQPWFRQKYGNVYNILIQAGAEPQDSPEHNQMQATFLADDRCFALADLLYPSFEGKYGVPSAQQLLEADPCYVKFRECVDLEVSEANVVNRTFEDRGWDVTYEVASATIRTRCEGVVPPLPACSCQCDHTSCPADARCHDGAGWCYHISHTERRSIDAGDHCDKACYWHPRGLSHEERGWLKKRDHWFTPSYHGIVRAELKPDLGDDYPAVLRQVTGYPRVDGDRRCVIARRYAFEHVTWDQVRQIFAASRITLLAEGEITS